MNLPNSITPTKSQSEITPEEKLTLNPQSDFDRLARALAMAAAVGTDEEEGTILFDSALSIYATWPRVVAYSSDLNSPARPFVHVDQLFELWVHFLTHPWSIPALHNLTGDNLRVFNKLFTWSLDIRDDPKSHRDVAEDMIHTSLR